MQGYSRQRPRRGTHGARHCKGEGTQGSRGIAEAWIFWRVLCSNVRTFYCRPMLVWFVSPHVLLSIAVRSKGSLVFAARKCFVNSCNWSSRWIAKQVLQTRGFLHQINTHSAPKLATQTSHFLYCQDTLRMLPTPRFYSWNHPFKIKRYLICPELSWHASCRNHMHMNMLRYVDGNSDPIPLERFLNIETAQLTFPRRIEIRSNCAVRIETAANFSELDFNCFMLTESCHCSLYELSYAFRTPRPSCRCTSGVLQVHAPLSLVKELTLCTRGCEIVLVLQYCPAIKIKGNALAVCDLVAISWSPLLVEWRKVFSGV